MNLEQIPSEIYYNDVSNNTYSFSPIMYKKIRIKNPNVIKLKELLVEGKEYNKGNEPGSQWYLKESDFLLIRTKSLQDFSYLLYSKGESIIPINPRVFIGTKLDKGDILLSKDSNIGEVAIIDRHYDFMDYSGGIVKLNLRNEINPYYLFACLKHESFREQLLSLCPKGATIQHAGEKWMSCLIAFPNQKNAEQIIDSVAKMVQFVMFLERTIAVRSQKILDKISETLSSNMTGSKIEWQYPTYKDLKKENRLDAAIYGEEYKRKIQLVEKFKDGYWTPSEYGFKVFPGPSLEIKLLKTRIDSDTPVPGFYKLILPTNISEFGTLNKMQYLGTKKKLPFLLEGDVLFGEAGFQKGRSIVIMEKYEKCTTNAHGLYARSDDNDIRKSIYFRCIFDWYRNNRLIDLMAVGGSGGHFSPEYFDYIKIPKFHDDIIDIIVKCYSNNNDIQFGVTEDIMNNSSWTEAGIVQLSKEVAILKIEINDIIEKVLNNDEIVIR